MSDQIQFEGENNSANYKSRAILGNPQTPKMIRFLINKGIVKSEKSAGYLLLGLAVFFVCLAIFITAVFVFRYNPFAPTASLEDPWVSMQKSQ